MSNKTADNPSGHDTSRQCWVTLATNDTYCVGALVLAHSIRDNVTSRKIVVIITSEVTAPMRQLLAEVFDEVKDVEAIIK